MFTKKIVDTYVIKSANENAYRANENGKLMRNQDGNLEMYDREDTVDVVARLINENKIKKGIKVDNPRNKKYIVYVFDYVEEHGDTKEKIVYRVKVGREYLKENKDLTDRLDAYTKTATLIKKQNIGHNIIKGIVGFVAAIATTVTLLAGLEKELETNEQNDRIYIERLNESRREENLPPLGATYEDGRPFEGSYVDWAKYISGYTDEFGNVIVEEGEIPTPRTFGN